LFHRAFADVFRDLHRAEVRAAHAVEVGRLGASLREGFVTELSRALAVEADIELILPAAQPSQPIIAAQLPLVITQVKAPS
jgi:hypothetical protein